MAGSRASPIAPRLDNPRKESHLLSSNPHDFSYTPRDSCTSWSSTRSLSQPPSGTRLTRPPSHRRPSSTTRSRLPMGPGLCAFGRPLQSTSFAISWSPSLDPSAAMSTSQWRIGKGSPAHHAYHRLRRRARPVARRRYPEHANARAIRCPDLRDSALRGPSPRPRRRPRGSLADGTASVDRPVLRPPL